MNLIPLSSSASAAAALAMLSLVAVPVAEAGQAGARPRGGAAIQGQAVPRREVTPAPAPAAQPPPPVGTSRTERPPATEPAVREFRAPPATAMARTVPRVITPQNDHPVYRPDYRPNYYYAPQYRRDYRPYYRSDYYRSDYYRPYYRPYYTFRPRVFVGFGLWVGHPVSFPYYHFQPYAYSYPYPYSYPSYPVGTPPYPYTAPVPLPGTAGALGGLSFDIRPADARIYVDGQYVGMASQFSPNQPPLSLAPGRHRIEIHASGFQVIAFDVDIAPGQVIPYQGDLRQF